MWLDKPTHVDSSYKYILLGDSREVTSVLAFVLANAQPLLLLS
jgi:hypothetical protein